MQQLSSDIYFPYAQTYSPFNRSRASLKVYSLSLLDSFRESDYCREKPSDLPEFMDREKINTDTSLGKATRKPRRASPVDSEPSEPFVQKSYLEGSNRGHHQGVRRENVGWQPANHQEHAEQFINRIPQNSRLPANRPHDASGRIIPGKGVPRRGNDPAGSQRPPVISRNMEHQPALYNVVPKQQQGVGAFATKDQTSGGLDSFSMGDIRLAERFLESGKMGLDEYARKLAAGEINRSGQPELPAASSGFFADDDAGSSRPWDAKAGGMAGRSQASQHTKLVPGYASQKPSPVPATPSNSNRIAQQPSPMAPTHQLGKESNASGLALLQMLIDRKAAGKAPQTASVGASPQGPRQLSQQQINELISMAKRAAPKAQLAPVDPGLPSHPIGPAPSIQRKHPSVHPSPGFQSMNLPQGVPVATQHGVAKAAPTQTPPHVAALLEQLHRQQVSQQQTAQPAPTAPPPECQQQ